MCFTDLQCTICCVAAEFYLPQSHRVHGAAAAESIGKSLTENHAPLEFTERTCANYFRPLVRGDGARHERKRGMFIYHLQIYHFSSARALPIEGGAGRGSAMQCGLAILSTVTVRTC